MRPIPTFPKRLPPTAAEILQHPASVPHFSGRTPTAFASFPTRPGTHTMPYCSSSEKFSRQCLPNQPLPHSLPLLPGVGVPKPSNRSTRARVRKIRPDTGALIHSYALSFRATRSQSATSALFVPKRPGWGVPSIQLQGSAQPAPITPAFSIRYSHANKAHKFSRIQKHRGAGVLLQDPIAARPVQAHDRTKNAETKLAATGRRTASTQHRSKDRPLH